MYAAIGAVLMVTAATLWACGVIPWWVAAGTLAMVAACGVDAEEYDGDDDL